MSNANLDESTAQSLGFTLDEINSIEKEGNESRAQTFKRLAAELENATRVGTSFKEINGRRSGKKTRRNILDKELKKHIQDIMDEYVTTSSVNYFKDTTTGRYLTNKEIRDTFAAGGVPKTKLGLSRNYVRKILEKYNQSGLQTPIIPNVYINKATGNHQSNKFIENQLFASNVPLKSAAASTPSSSTSTTSSSTTPKQAAASTPSSSTTPKQAAASTPSSSTTPKPAPSSSTSTTASSSSSSSSAAASTPKPAPSSSTSTTSSSSSSSSSAAFSKVGNYHDKDFFGQGDCAPRAILGALANTPGGDLRPLRNDGTPYNTLDLREALLQSPHFITHYARLYVRLQNEIDEHRLIKQGGDYWIVERSYDKVTGTWIISQQIDATQTYDRVFLDAFFNKPNITLNEFINGVVRPHFAKWDTWFSETDMALAVDVLRDMIGITLVPLQQHQDPEEGINFTNQVAVRNFGAYHWVSVIHNSVNPPYLKPDAPAIGAAQVIATPLNQQAQTNVIRNAKRNVGLPRKSRKNRTNRKHRRNTRRH